MIFNVKKPFYKNLDFKKKSFFKKRKIIYKDKDYILYKFLDVSEKNFLLLKKNTKFFFIKKINLKQKVSNLSLINKFLEKKKIKIPKIVNFSFLNKIKKKIGFKYFIIFEFIDGRHSINQLNDFKFLAINLFKLHHAFKKYTPIRKAKINTIKRMKLLEKGVKSFNSSKLKKNTRLYNVQKILKNETFLFDNFYKNLKYSSIIHGDLIPGNIIKSKKNFFFIDFEDCFHSFFLIDLDIAIIIERMILLEKHSNSIKLKKINYFLKFYSRFCKKKLFLSQDLYSSLKFINLRALTTLVVSPFRDKDAFDNELKKFLFLFHELEKNKIFLKKIDDYVKK